MRLRIFVDFWNFSLNWNDRAGGAKPDWTKLPLVLKDEADNVLKAGGLGMLVLEETRVYASYEPGREASLKNWLHNFLDRQPGFRVFTVERHWKKHSVHCRKCSNDLSVCPNCGTDLGRAAEKTVDSRIVTDMLSLAWEGGFDTALLLSSDRDFIPAVEKLQAKNFKVINATWALHILAPNRHRKCADGRENVQASFWHGAATFPQLADSRSQPVPFVNFRQILARIGYADLV